MNQGMELAVLKSLTHCGQNNDSHVRRIAPCANLSTLLVKMGVRKQVIAPFERASSRDSFVSMATQFTTTALQTTGFNRSGLIARIIQTTPPH
jgi:hypothetical protein